MKQTKTHYYFYGGWASNFFETTNTITVPLSPIAAFSEHEDLYEVSCQIEKTFPFHEEHFEGGLDFPTSEHVFMWLKAIYFKDYATAAKVLTVDHPADAKQCGREVVGFNAEAWTAVSPLAMLYANLLKYTQNYGIAKILLETKDLRMVEASKSDKIWGVGLYESDPLILDEKNWKGANLLGICLMQVRKLLRNYFWN